MTDRLVATEGKKAKKLRKSATKNDKKNKKEVSHSVTNRQSKPTKITSPSPTPRASCGLTCKKALRDKKVKKQANNHLDIFESWLKLYPAFEFGLPYSFHEKMVIKHTLLPKIIGAITGIKAPKAKDLVLEKEREEYVESALERLCIYSDRSFDYTLEKWREQRKAKHFTDSFCVQMRDFLFELFQCFILEPCLNIPRGATPYVATYTEALIGWLETYLQPYKDITELAFASTLQKTFSNTSVALALAHAVSGGKFNLERALRSADDEEKKKVINKYLRISLKDKEEEISLIILIGFTVAKANRKRILRNLKQNAAEAKGRLASLSPEATPTRDFKVPEAPNTYVPHSSKNVDVAGLLERFSMLENKVNTLQNEVISLRQQVKQLKAE